jgi:hypothetical protein
MFSNYLEFIKMEEVQKLSDSECYALISVPFKSYCVQFIIKYLSQIFVSFMNLELSFANI